MLSAILAASRQAIPRDTLTGTPDYTRIQESVKSTEVNDFGYLQQVLSKLAVDSQNKSARSPMAGFDSLYSVFRATNASSSVFGQNLTLCTPTAKGYFEAAAASTGNKNFTSLYPDDLLVLPHACK